MQIKPVFLEMCIAAKNHVVIIIFKSVYGIETGAVCAEVESSVAKGCNKSV